MFIFGLKHCTSLNESWCKCYKWYLYLISSSEVCPQCTVRLHGYSGWDSINLVKSSFSFRGGTKKFCCEVVTVEHSIVPLRITCSFPFLSFILSMQTPNRLQELKKLGIVTVWGFCTVFYENKKKTATNINREAWALQRYINQAFLLLILLKCHIRSVMIGDAF